MANRSTILYANPGRVFSSRSSSTIPVSKQRRRFSNEWKLKEATWGLPHRSAPSSTSSSYLIHLAVSRHSHSSPLPCSSSSWTNNSCGEWSYIFLKVSWGMPPSFRRPICTVEWAALCRRIPRGSSLRWDSRSSMSSSCRVLASSGWTLIRRVNRLELSGRPAPDRFRHCGSSCREYLRDLWWWRLRKCIENHQIVSREAFHIRSKKTKIKWLNDCWYWCTKHLFTICSAILLAW